MTAFGALLKDWRGKRRLSQMALGLEADVSSRHIAFLETGRFAPSRKMVLHLSDVLSVPRPDRNDLLSAAGFAPAYPKREMDDDELAPLRAAIDYTIQRHAPYPAIVIDRLWNLVSANAPAWAMLGGFGLGPGDNLLRALFDRPDREELYENWPELGHHMIRRLRTESAHHGGLPELDAFVAELSADPAIAAYDPPLQLPAVVPARYRMGDQVLSLITTIAEFGSAEELTIADLRTELMFPADAATETALRTLFGSAPN